MAGGIEAEIVQESLTSGTEIVTAEDGQQEMQDVDSAMSDYIAKRKAEHPEWYGENPEKSSKVQEKAETEAEAEAESQESEESEAEQVSEESKPKTKGKSKEESESQVLKRVLSRERKLRRKEAEFEAKYSEITSKLEEYEEAKRLAKIDPVSLLKSLDLDNDEFIKVAKDLYYTALGDLAPEEYKGEQEKLQLRRELQLIKQKLEAKEKGADGEDALVQYQQSLVTAAQNVDADLYPHVADVIDSYSVHTVAADMFQIAQQYAVEMNGQGAPMSSDQLLARVNKEYARVLNRAEADVQTPVKKVAAKRKTTLSNNLNKTQPLDTPLSEDMSYEEIAKRSRARFNKLMGG